MNEKPTEAELAEFKRRISFDVLNQLGLLRYDLALALGRKFWKWPDVGLGRSKDYEWMTNRTDDLKLHECGEIRSDPRKFWALVRKLRAAYVAHVLTKA